MVGFVKCIKSQKLLIIANVYDTFIDRDAYYNCSMADKLIIYDVEKNAQYYNINSTLLPNIKECYFMKGYVSSFCSKGLLTFEKLYIPLKMHSFRTAFPDYKTHVMSNEKYYEYMNLIEKLDLNEKTYYSDKSIKYIIEE